MTNVLAPRAHGPAHARLDGRTRPDDGGPGPDSARAASCSPRSRGRSRASCSNRRSSRSLRRGGGARRACCRSGGAAPRHRRDGRRPLQRTRALRSWPGRLGQRRPEPGPRARPARRHRPAGRDDRAAERRAARPHRRGDEPRPPHGHGWRLRGGCAACAPRAGAPSSPNAAWRASPMSASGPAGAARRAPRSASPSTGRPGRPSGSARRPEAPRRRATRCSSPTPRRAGAPRARLRLRAPSGRVCDDTASPRPDMTLIVRDAARGYLGVTVLSPERGHWRVLGAGSGSVRVRLQAVPRMQRIRGAPAAGLDAAAPAAPHARRGRARLVVARPARGHHGRRLRLERRPGAGPPTRGQPPSPRSRADPQGRPAQRPQPLHARRPARRHHPRPGAGAADRVGPLRG